MQRPVIILGMARSGTSMIASIFRAHGFWCGITRSDRPSNYPTGQHENLAVKRLLISRYGRADERMIGVDYDKDWEHIARKILRKEGYKGGQWFVKHSALYGRIWEDFSPVYVCVRRDSIAILDSIRRKNPNDKTADLHYQVLIQNHSNTMDEILAERGGFNIHSEKLISGDYSELLKVMEATGIQISESKIKEIIQPNIWGVTV